MKNNDIKGYAFLCVICLTFYAIFTGGERTLKSYSGDNQSVAADSVTIDIKKARISLLENGKIRDAYFLNITIIKEGKTMRHDDPKSDYLGDTLMFHNFATLEAFIHLSNLKIKR